MRERSDGVIAERGGSYPAKGDVAREDRNLKSRFTARLQGDAEHGKKTHNFYKVGG